MRMGVGGDILVVCIRIMILLVYVLFEEDEVIVMFGEVISGITCRPTTYSAVYFKTTCTRCSYRIPRDPSGAYSVTSLEYSRP
jgi:hypothetical protein